MGGTQWMWDEVGLCLLPLPGLGALGSCGFHHEDSKVMQLAASTATLASHPRHSLCQQVPAQFRPSISGDVLFS